MRLLETRRVEELLERIRSIRVGVVGDVMLDRYVSGIVERVSPEAPVPVVRVESESSAVGGAGNVAANVTALGGRCELVGCVGSDSEGEALLAALAESGVGCGGIVRDPGRPTTVKTRVLAKHQQIVRFDREVDSPVGADLTRALAGHVREIAETCDVLVAQDYDKGTLAPGVISAVEDAASVGTIPWVVDPKRRSFFSYAGATVFKPNARELAEALGEGVNPNDPVWMEGIRVRIGCEHLLLTLGERGMSLASNGKAVARLPTAARDVYDVSGAGDTVTAAVALTLAAGASMFEAACFANYAAAVEVGKSGVRTVSPSELMAKVRGDA